MNNEETIFDPTSLNNGNEQPRYADGGNAQGLEKPQTSNHTGAKVAAIAGAGVVGTAAAVYGATKVFNGDENESKVEQEAKAAGHNTDDENSHSSIKDLFASDDANGKSGIGTMSADGETADGSAEVATTDAAADAADAANAQGVNANVDVNGNVIYADSVNVVNVNINGVDVDDEFIPKEYYSDYVEDVDLGEPIVFDHELNLEGVVNGLLVADNVSDEMSFNQAFAAARQEVGPGGVFEWRGKIYNTFYAEEWNNMTAEQKMDFNSHFDWSNYHDDYVASNHHVQNVYEGDEFVAKAYSPDMAEGVNDNMSFNQAFAAARAEVGPGGTFEWRGKIYNTFYAEEWNSMSAQEKADFTSSIDMHAHSDNHYAANVGAEQVTPAEPQVIQIVNTEGGTVNVFTDENQAIAMLTDENIVDEVEIIGGENLEVVDIDEPLVLVDGLEEVDGVDFEYDNGYELVDNYDDYTAENLYEEEEIDFIDDDDFSADDYDIADDMTYDA